MSQETQEHIVRTLHYIKESSWSILSAHKSVYVYIYIPCFLIAFLLNFVQKHNFSVLKSSMRTPISQPPDKPNMEPQILGQYCHMLLLSSNRKDKDGLYPSLTTLQTTYVFLVAIHKTRTTMMQ